MAGVFGSNKPAYQSQQEGVAGNLGDVGGTAQNFGKKESKAGFKSLQSVMQYLKPLVSGDRGAMTEVLAPELKQIGSSFDSAKSHMAEFGPRGGGTTSAVNNAETGKAEAISDTYLKARPAAANMMTNIGGILTGAGTSNLGTAAGAYGQQGNQYANLAQQIAAERARRTAAWGSVIGGASGAAGAFLGSR